MTIRAIDIVRARCPHAHPNYVQAFETGDGALIAAGVTNRLRLAHFLAQCFHETGDLTILVESMSYSAARMMDVWPGRFPTLQSAAPYAHNPQALAEHTYGGRMGNRPEGSGDGWRYIGRGLIQCTGRESYAAFGARLGIDLVGNPDLAADPRYTLQIALAEWTDKGCNALADRNDIYGISRRINGGLIGIDDREQEFNDIWPLLLADRDATFTTTWAAASAGDPAPSQPWAQALPDTSTAALQKALNTLLGAGLVVDGKAGPDTRKATVDFQRAHGLTVDGIAGTETWAAIKAAQAA